MSDQVGIQFLSKRRFPENTFDVCSFAMPPLQREVSLRTEGSLQFIPLLFPLCLSFLFFPPFFVFFFFKLHLFYGRGFPDSALLTNQITPFSNLLKIPLPICPSPQISFLFSSFFSFLYFLFDFILFFCFFLSKADQY